MLAKKQFWKQGSKIQLNDCKDTNEHFKDRENHES